MIDDIKLYAAPLEGITGFVWRRAQRTVFGGVDKYFTPFISANQNHVFQTKELRDISQGESDLVPQIITDKAEHFIWAYRELRERGYEEVNINMGCPSGTVTTKGKGSGALRELEKMDHFFDEIFTELHDAKVSVKTRTGFYTSEEWPNILKVYEKHPICELTVHPRCRKEFYEGRADRELFLKTLNETKLPLAYNGDIYDKDDEAFTYGVNLMAGRGLIIRPSLYREARGGDAAKREELKTMHEMMVEGYKEYLSGDMPLVRHMKEFWNYYSQLFEDTDSQLKKIRKAKSFRELELAADDILRNCRIK